jgi:cytochrome c
VKTLRLSIAALLAASGWILSDEASAQAGADVLKAKNCLTCHDAEKKKMGPSFKDIAAKQAGKSDELVAKLKGAKHPKVNATDAELKAAVDHILATK